MGEYTKNDGGPAFPVQHKVGMSLRDWFAGQALSMAWNTFGGMGAVRIANTAYDIADAMLAEREKQK